jgi:hypothetical protein
MRFWLISERVERRYYMLPEISQPAAAGFPEVPG